jgi:hypothetical protein
MAESKPKARMSLRLVTELWFLCLVLLCPLLIYGVLRWERATTRTCIAAVAAHDTKQLDTLFWMHRFAPGTRKVINRWTTDFGDFPQQAACDSSRPVAMPGAGRLMDLRLWLLSPVVPIIRHRLDVQIGDDGKVTDSRYDTHEWYFTPTNAGGGSFTNQGLSFRFSIPVPVLICMAAISWLLALACRALGKYARRRQSIPSAEVGT